MNDQQIEVKYYKPLGSNIVPSIFAILLFAVIIFLICVIFIGCKSSSGDKSVEIQIQWVDELDGDFSFKDIWSYPEGVYMNEFGQLSCDGFCPPEIDRMFDEDRRILTDSLDAFYSLVDTTHLFHSIESEAVAYEWVGTDFIKVKRPHKDTVICYTMNNAGTHSSLNLVITGNAVTSTIELNSITPYYDGIQSYYCSKGEMTIDKNLWEQGILKAEFDFKFVDKEFPDIQMYWKGKIYAEIKE